MSPDGPKVEAARRGTNIVIPDNSTNLITPRGTDHEDFYQLSGPKSGAVAKALHLTRSPVVLVEEADKNVTFQAIPEIHHGCRFSILAYQSKLWRLLRVRRSRSLEIRTSTKNPQRGNVGDGFIVLAIFF